MTENNTNGESILKVVKLFIDNINESTKTVSKNVEKATEEIEKVKTKVNTPPRNEELCAQIADVDAKVDEINTGLASINQSIQSMILTVKVALAVLSIAIILSTTVSTTVMYFNKSASINTDYIVDKIEQKLEEGRGLKHVVDKEGNVQN